MEHWSSTRNRTFLIGIAVTLGVRQFVLLVALPLIAVYVIGLDGGSPAIAGVALGVFGLFQALLQIPFGRWSDRAGRKTMVLAGTALLVAGLLIAAVADSVALFVVGRALQGAGAITGTAYAWIADRTPHEEHNRAMGVAAVAAAIGAIASFLCGPLLYSVLSVPRVFAICAAIAALNFIYVLVAMDDRPSAPRLRSARPNLPELLRIGGVRPLLMAGFLLNYVLMAVSFVLPLAVERASDAHDLWKVIVPAIIVGILAMRGATRLADRGHSAILCIIAFAAFIPAGISFLVPELRVIAIGATLFMAAYLSLFALLPAAAARRAGSSARGTVNGALQTAMFLGAFAGAVATGFLWGWSPPAAVAGVGAAAALGLLAVLKLASGRQRLTASEIVDLGGGHGRI